MYTRKNNENALCFNHLHSNNMKNYQKKTLVNSKLKYVQLNKIKLKLKLMDQIKFKFDL